MCQIFQSFNCNVIKDDLDAGHWFKDKEWVILKFCQINDNEKVLKAKNELQKLSAIKLDNAEGLWYSLIRVCALTIVWFSQQAKHFMVSAKLLFGYVSNRFHKASGKQTDNLHFFIEHCVKSVRIKIYSDPHFPAFGPYPVRMWENSDQNNSEYVHFLRSGGFHKEYFRNKYHCTYC